ncbi:hypothetical protein ACTQ5F_07970 [Jeotgalibaca porci]|uniref:hypothetical protein n=1 Tax=Jeotgalibaca porci TaxID=1868793 RepID=UPI003F8F5756
MKNVTVKSIVESIVTLTQTPIENEDGFHVNAEDVLAMIRDDVELLADLLGFSLEG